MIQTRSHERNSAFDRSSENVTHRREAILAGYSRSLSPGDVYEGWRVDTERLHRTEAHTRDTAIDEYRPFRAATMQAALERV